ncbi:MAG TPA: aromatic amino acid lyase, partial [Thermoanaerobaculia bacterium]
MKPLKLSGQDLRLEDLVAVSRRAARVSLTPAARRAMAASRRVVDRAIRGREKVYGVTTGFGKFSDVAIPPGEIADLQRNLIRSHAAGVGAPLESPAVRAMMLLRARS